MASVSETPFVHHHDDALTSTARLVSADTQRADLHPLDDVVGLRLSQRPPTPITAVKSSRRERDAAAAAGLRHAFCTQLRESRERRGIALQTISEHTKISEGLLADLERCELSRWPSGIYRRAFFREYAAMVGIPGESTVSEFARLFPDDLEQPTSELLVPGP